MRENIREFFKTHELDGSEFFACSSGCPWSVVAPKPDSETVVYSTKTHCLSKLIHDLDGKQSFGAIMRSGLPSDEDMSWIGAQVSSRRLLFFGDADPVDLLIFAWLREHLSVTYAGLSDDLLRKCEVDLRDNFTIQLTEPEVSALQLVEACLGDVHSYIGGWCTDLLLSGRKVELEALFSFATCTPLEFEAALLESA